MIGARFIENETGTQVLVDAVGSWDSEEATLIVTYPSGRKYAVGSADFGKHFAIISPQEVFVDAIALDDRPTKKQREA